MSPENKSKIPRGLAMLLSSFNIDVGKLDGAMDNVVGAVKQIASDLQTIKQNQVLILNRLDTLDQKFTDMDTVSASEDLSIHSEAGNGKRS